MALKTNAEKIRQGYINACNAVLGRGGSIASGAPIGDLAEAIINIPHDTTLAYHEVNSTAYRTLVPQNAEPYARINKIGGMSYKTRNLIPFPYSVTTTTISGVTFTDNGDGSWTVNGTSHNTIYFKIVDGLKLLNATYTASGASSNVSLQFDCNGTAKYAYENIPVTIEQTTDMSNTDIYMQVRNGVTISNEIVYPQLELGTEATKFEPFFEGIRDTKATALKSEGANLAHSISEGSNTTITDGVVTQIEADTYEEILFKCQLYSKTGYQSGGVVKRLYATGVHSATFNKEGAETRCVFGINGKIIDTVIAIDITDLPIGEYTVSANFTNITQGSISWKDIMLNAGSVAIPYTPYVGTIDTLAIPEAVQSIEGYGLGVNENYFNYIDFGRNVFKAPCKRFVIDGSIGTYTTSPFANAWYIVVSTLGYSDRIITGLADKYHSLTYHELYAGGIDGIYLSNSSEIFIIDSRFSDAATAKAILSESPIECVCAFDTESETDISEYLTDEFIKVEGGGTITAVNEHEEGVPTSVTYLIETVGG